MEGRVRKNHLEMAGNHVIVYLMTLLRKYSNLSEKARVGLMREVIATPPVNMRGLWGFPSFSARASPSEPLGSLPINLRVYVMLRLPKDRFWLS